MIEFPGSVLKIARDCAEKYSDDVEAAIVNAEKKIWKLKGFKEEIVPQLVRRCIADLVYDARHIINRQIKRDTGQYGGPAKVTSGDSAGVSRAAQSCYNYYIAGTILGAVFGEQLAGIVENELAISEGHSFNARLCVRLSKIVPKDKQVRDVVSEQKLRSIFRAEQRGKR